MFFIIQECEVRAAQPSYHLILTERIVKSVIDQIVYEKPEYNLLNNYFLSQVLKYNIMLYILCHDVESLMNVFTSVAHTKRLLALEQLMLDM